MAEIEREGMSFTTAGYKPPQQKPLKKEKPKHKRKRPNGAAVVSVFVFILAVLLSSFIIWLYLETKEYTNTFLPGIFVSGEPLEGKTYDQASDRLKVIEKNDFSDFTYTFEYEGGTSVYTSEDFEMAYDIEKTLDPLFAIGHESGMISRLLSMLKLKAEPIFEMPEMTYSLENVEQDLKRIKEELDSDPVDATVRYLPSESEPFVYTDEIAGMRVITKDVMETVKEAVESHTTGIYVIQTDRIEPDVTRAELQNSIRLMNRVTCSLGSGAAAENAELAILQLNGASLGSMEQFSFNDYIGQRTAEHGYEYAKEPAYGWEVYGIGGGICRASSLLYQCALGAGLEIVTRSASVMLPEDWEPGEEATVSDQGLDLVIRNNSSMPIFFHSRVYEKDGNKMAVLEIMGERQAAKIQIVHESELLPAAAEPLYLLDSEGIYARYTDDRVPRNAAIDGRIVTTSRIYYDESGLIQKEETVGTDTYEPIPECIWVGTEVRE